jgi:hypothetical protein
LTLSHVLFVCTFGLLDAFLTSDCSYLRLVSCCCSGFIRGIIII